MRHPSTLLFASKQRLILIASSYITSVSLASNTFARSSPDVSVAHKQPIHEATLSEDGTRLATTDESKTIKIWDTINWSLVSERKAERRVSSMKFTKDCKFLIAADKSGDVYNFELANNNPPKLLLGHVSIITDLDLSPKNDYVITADRDEKVRVSRYPNAYNIQSFCLGHTQIVSQVHTLKFLSESNPIVISGGGDGYLNLWQIVDGKCLQSIDLKEIAKIDQEYLDIRTICSSESSKLVAIITECVPKIFLFEVKEGPSLVHTQTIEVEGNPCSISFDEERKGIWISTDNQNNLSSFYSIKEKEVSLDNTKQELVKFITESLPEVDSIPPIFTYSTLRKAQYGKGKKEEESDEEGSDEEQQPSKKKEKKK